MKLGLQPHVTLLALQYPVDDLRLAVNQFLEAHDAASNAPAERHRRTVRRYRRSSRNRSGWRSIGWPMVYFRRLEREEYRVLDALRRGLPLGGAVETALEGTEMPEDRIGAAMREWFEAWAELGLFSKPEKN